ncbi:hypothetical protein IMZ31_19185 (plasmid) [Pontibacillus sp. ALD_SL1]|uniref:hypothetical protein n=1 Tax=Pontibacillus sp. ALD_SL1 TaxID=2777185 RepID=UPI001A965F47|nr:hypothetical protein [Pontibacillus sp. ALD_SL1]QST02675.1 hypothetical protein IMZ31_19185 [Pontibacillus sp. ALD_SL1]
MVLLLMYLCSIPLSVVMKRYAIRNSGHTETFNVRSWRKRDTVEAFVPAINVFWAWVDFSEVFFTKRNWK